VEVDSQRAALMLGERIEVAARLRLLDRGERVAVSEDREIDVVLVGDLKEYAEPTLAPEWRVPRGMWTVSPAASWMCRPSTSISNSPSTMWMVSASFACVWVGSDHPGGGWSISRQNAPPVSSLTRWISVATPPGIDAKRTPPKTQPFRCGLRRPHRK
jgi:hypothetical protein